MLAELSYSLDTSEKPAYPRTQISSGGLKWDFHEYSVKSLCRGNIPGTYSNAGALLLIISTHHCLYGIHSWAEMLQMRQTTGVRSAGGFCAVISQESSSSLVKLWPVSLYYTPRFVYPVETTSSPNHYPRGSKLSISLSWIWIVLKLDDAPE